MYSQWQGVRGTSIPGDVVQRMVVLQNKTESTLNLMHSYLTYGRRLTYNRLTFALFLAWSEGVQHSEHVTQTTIHADVACLATLEVINWSGRNLRGRQRTAAPRVNDERAIFQPARLYSKNTIAEA